MQQPNQFETTDTPLAAYLIQSGFDLVEIRYEIKPNSKRQAVFIFNSSHELDGHAADYARGDAVVNLSRFEHVRSSLLDRIMRGGQ